jgi:hypothetical protein
MAGERRFVGALAVLLLLVGASAYGEDGHGIRMEDGPGPRCAAQAASRVSCNLHNLTLCIFVSQAAEARPRPRPRPRPWTPSRPRSTLPAGTAAAADGVQA